MDRYALHRARVLEFLRARGLLGATTAELCDPSIGGHEGTRRVRELRELGYPIFLAPERTGYYRYWLGRPPWPQTTQLDLFREA